MPLIGTGIVPSGALGTELTYITRRAFVPKLIVQLYNSTPVLSGMLANAQTASGGISSVTVPVQGTALVTAQMTDYSGAFNQPSDVAGIFEADYNLKALVVPIPFLGMEGLVQLDAAIIPKIEAKMNDAGNQAAALLSTQLLTNATDQTINLDGYPLVAATTGTYGNINRATNTWWAGHTLSTAGGVAPTRQRMLELIVSAAKANGGEMPTLGVLGPGTWASLAEDYQGLEQFIRTGEGGREMTGRSGFTALMVADVPFYMDLGQTEGTVLVYNTRYDAIYIHEAAAFVFTGFASTLPNFTLGYVGAVVAVLEHVNTKPASVTQQAGYTFATV